jgi:hypothetical protein
MFQIALEILKQNSDAILKAKDDGEAILALNEYASTVTDCQVENSSQVTILVIFIGNNIVLLFRCLSVLYWPIHIGILGLFIFFIF